MFKFLRKYNKWILAVGGTLLVIVFLIPQALTSLSQRAATRGVAWGTIGGDKLTEAERLAAEQELRVLQQTGYYGLFNALIGLDSVEHWYLLSVEAEEAGLVRGRGALEMTPEQLAQLFPNQRQISTHSLDTLAKVEAVMRLIARYDQAPYSDRRLRGYAHLMASTVEADIVAIMASPDEVDDQPSDAELQEQLDLYGELAPGEGDMGFGYRLPDRFKIEWLNVNRDAIAASIEATDALNEMELRRHWRRRGGVAGIPVVKVDEAVPDAVREDLLDQLTTEKIQEIARFASQAVRDPQLDLKTTGGYYDLGDDWADKKVDYSTLAEDIRAHFDIELPTWESIGDRWLTADDLLEVDELNTATTADFRDRPVQLPDVIVSLHEFGGESTVPVQANITLPTFTDGDGNLLVIRVTETDGSRPPSGIDEVRDDIIDDLRRKKHYDTLISQVDAIEETAQTKGMMDVALEWGEPIERRSVFMTNQDLLNIVLNSPTLQVPLSPSELPGVGMNEDAVKEIVAHCIALPSDGTFGDLPVEDRTLVVPVEKGLALLVVQARHVRPVSRDLFDLLVDSGRIRQMVVAEEYVDQETSDVREAFGYDGLAARHEFVPVAPQITDEDGDGVPDDEQEEADA